MIITVSEKEEVVIFRLKGRIISPGIKKVLETVEEETLTGHASSPRLVFDFKEVTRIDGAWTRYTHENLFGGPPTWWEIAVINMNKHVKNLIVMTRLTTVLECFKSEDDAITALLRHP